MQKQDSNVMGNIVQQLTTGQPYVFVIMSYQKRWDLYEVIKRTIAEEVQLLCIRADDVPAAGHDLLEKIHLLIDRAELVVAEISDDSPNVFYEVGYTVGTHRPMLLIADHETEIPTDLKGRQIMYHGGSRDAAASFTRDLRDYVRLHLNSRIAALQDMLLADSPQPVYIVANPKAPAVNSPFNRLIPDARTYGDNVGILGLIKAFGALLSERGQVELVTATYIHPSVVTASVNVYLIGSPKVNPHTGLMMERLQSGREPAWRFGPAGGEQETCDYRLALHRSHDGNESLLEARRETTGPDGLQVIEEDYGIILRGPHPDHTDRIAMVIAGAHSLGSGAACTAATHSSLIRQIMDRLPEPELLADKKKTIWALVKGRANPKDSHLDPEDVTVVEAGVYS